VQIAKLHGVVTGLEREMAAADSFNSRVVRELEERNKEIVMLKVSAQAN